MSFKRFFKLFIYILTMITTIIYIVYRIFFTIPAKLGFVSIFFALLVLFVEIWEAFDFFIYFINILMVKPKEYKTSNIIDEYPDIDIFIATLNEPEGILCRTIEACLNLNYPDKNKLHIYLCDDGNRLNIKNLAKNYNINYISRLTNRNFKAGNYNNALNKTSSPYIATFDADMAPTPNFLEVTLPHFKDANKIGFVQLPQSFINPDIYQYRFGVENYIPFEQDYFYHSLQISKNATNSAVYCGTNTLFARQALKDVGGFATGTLSEDIATGMLIESKGYTCIALNDISAYGKSVNDFDGFIKQRSRWAKGCVQMLKKYNILNLKGLSIRQKLEYLSCVSYWFFGFRRMVYLLAPLLFSIFGIIIIDCNLPVFLSIWIPTYLLKRYVLDKLEGNKRSSTWSKIYETVLAPVLCIDVLKEFFGLNPINFEVSPKSNSNGKTSKKNKKLFATHFILLLLNVIGFIMCFTSVYDSRIYNYALSFVWTISNIYYLLFAVIFDSRTKAYEYNFTPNKVNKYSKKAIFVALFNRRSNKKCKN